MQRHKCSFGGFRLSPTPPTRSDEGSSRVMHALLAKNARSTELSTDFRLPYSTAPSHQPPLGRARNYKIGSTDDKKKDQKNPVEKRRFRLAESGCIRNGLMRRQRSMYPNGHCKAKTAVTFCASYPNRGCSPRRDIIRVHQVPSPTQPKSNTTRMSTLHGHTGS